MRALGNGQEVDARVGTEFELAERLRRREPAALKEAYDRYGRQCAAIARRTIRAHASADDVVQEVFLRLWREPDRFDPSRGSLRGFLLASVRCRVVDNIRSEDARRRREQRVGHSRENKPATTEELALDRTTAVRVETALAALSSVEREAVTLAYFGGYTYREVSTLLDVPEGTIKSRIRSGLVRLKAQLRSEVAAA